jgi:fructose-1-phosphate kinase PfkB-like protein
MPTSRSAVQNGIVIAGHVVIDEIIDKAGQRVPRTALGGGVSYGSIVLTSLGYNCKPVTRAGRDFPKNFRALLSSLAGFDISTSITRQYKTTKYRIDRTYEPRKMWLVSRSKQLQFSDFSNKFSDSPNDCAILNPVAGEISLQLLRRIRSRWTAKLFLDSQGFVRKLRVGAEVSMRPEMDASALSGVFALKADMEELRAWTGMGEKQSAVRELSKYVKVLLVTSGSGGADLFQDSSLLTSATPPAVNVADTTGAGDILLACFAARFEETKDLKESLSFAVAGATAAVKNLGITKAVLSKEAVQKQSGLVKLSS